MKLSKAFFYLMFASAVLVNLSACGQLSNKTEKDATTVHSESLIFKSEREWKQILNPDQYRILREKETEAPFTGKLLYNKEKGIYKCAGCGSELFTDEMKFDSHCGWPSFDREIPGSKIKKIRDDSHGMHRTEIVCSKCGGHLGHLFDDGPTSTGMRYCVNSGSLLFEKKSDHSNNQVSESKVNQGIDTITLGGGCYWCVEAVYERLNGVISVESGFSGGRVESPSYRQVCMGNTGHAEVVQIVFDSHKTNLDEILKVFFTVHDPTTLNRQGADEGEQYRSVIFYRNASQYKISKSIIDALNKNKVYDKAVVTALEPFKSFYMAESDHQNYYDQNKNKPYCKMVIQPKIEKFEKLFKDRLKKSE
jgi:peptide methionine sulfoxide reductase msrA/msrB